MYQCWKASPNCWLKKLSLKISLKSSKKRPARELKHKKRSKKIRKKRIKKRRLKKCKPKERTKGHKLRIQMLKSKKPPKIHLNNKKMKHLLKMP